jgi:hypothetical protein
MNNAASYSKDRIEAALNHYALWVAQAERKARLTRLERQGLAFARQMVADLTARLG